MTSGQPTLGHGGTAGIDWRANEHTASVCWAQRSLLHKPVGGAGHWGHLGGDVGGPGVDVDWRDLGEPSVPEGRLQLARAGMHRCPLAG